MNKILIIENEFDSVKVAFDIANVLCFDKQLEFENVINSQDCFKKELEEYVSIFVDISLAMKSDLDGYGILERILSEHDTLRKRTAIITGHSNIEDQIIKLHPNLSGVKILNKPLKYVEIADFIKSCMD